MGFSFIAKTGGWGSILWKMTGWVSGLGLAWHVIVMAIVIVSAIVIAIVSASVMAIVSASVMAIVSASVIVSAIVMAIVSASVIVMASQDRVGERQDCRRVLPRQGQPI